MLQIRRFHEEMNSASSPEASKDGVCSRQVLSQIDSLRCGERGTAALFKIIPCKAIQGDYPASFTRVTGAP